MENWSEIKEGGYEISTLGNIRNIKTGRVLKTHVGTAGYKRIGLYFNKKKIMFSVHRLVAKTFLPYNVDKPDVDHINRDRVDNRLVNLRFVSKSENMANSSKRGVSLKKISEIIKLYDSGMGKGEIYNFINNKIK